MRAVLLLAIAFAACGGAEPPVVKEPEPPPRDLGPIDIGPVAPEAKHVDTETYSIDIEIAPPQAKVKDKILATITVKAKGDLTLQTTGWKVEGRGPRDVDVVQPTTVVLPPTINAKTTAKYTMTVVPLRAGTKHVAVHVGGAVCDADFCDVVADEVSLNLDVK